MTRPADCALLGGLASLFLIALLCTEPASACSFVNAKAAMANAAAISVNYWIASILFGGALTGLEFRQRRFWLFPTITLALLVFHPRWTLPSLYEPDCVFVNVQTSQFVLATIVLMLGYRMVGHMLTERQRFAAAVCGVAVGAAVCLALVQFPPQSSGLNLRYILPKLVPLLLLAGITTGFLVAVGLGATRLLMSFARAGRTERLR
jgi:hypothetical protein